MDFYKVSDLCTMTGYKSSKVRIEINKWNATLKDKYKVDYVYPGRIRKDLYDLVTGCPQHKKSSTTMLPNSKM